MLGASPPKAREKTGRPDFCADFLMLAYSKKNLFAWQNIREHVHRGTACAPNMHVPAHANEQWNPGKRGKFQNPCLNLASGKLWSNWIWNIPGQSAVLTEQLNRRWHIYADCLQPSHTREISHTVCTLLANWLLHCNQILPHDSCSACIAGKLALTVYTFSQNLPATLTQQSSWLLQFFFMSIK